MLSRSFMNHEHAPACEHSARAFLAPLDRLHGLQVSTRFEPAEHAWYDAIVEVRSSAGTDRYAAETVNGVTTTTLPAVRRRLERVRAQTGLPPLPLTDHVTPAVAERLIDHATAFVDGAGTVHLDGAAAYVVIFGRCANRTFRLMFPALARHKCVCVPRPRRKRQPSDRPSMTSISSVNT